MKFSLAATSLLALGAAALPTSFSKLFARDVTAPFAIKLVTSGAFNGSYLTPASLNATFSELVPNVTADKHFAFNQTDKVAPNLGSLLYTFSDGNSSNGTYGPMALNRPNNYPILFSNATNATAIEVFQITQGSLVIRLEHAAGFFVCPTDLNNGTVTNQLQWNNYASVVNNTGCTPTQLQIEY